MHIYIYISKISDPYRILVLRRLTPMAIESATCSLACLMRPMHPQFFRRPNGVRPAAAEWGGSSRIL